MCGDLVHAILEVWRYMNLLLNVCSKIRETTIHRCRINLTYHFRSYFPKDISTKPNVPLSFNMVCLRFRVCIHRQLSEFPQGQGIWIIGLLSPPCIRVALFWWLLLGTGHYSISLEICTRFCGALLCCGYAIVHNEFTWSIYPYSSGLLCWHWGNL